MEDAQVKNCLQQGKMQRVGKNVSAKPCEYKCIQTVDLLLEQILLWC